MFETFHFVDSINLSSGGLRTAILGITRSLKNKEAKSTIFTLSKKKDSLLDQYQDNIYFLEKYELYKSFLKIKLKQSLFIEKYLVKAKKPIIHIHGMWLPITYFGYLVAKKYNVPYIFSPHGGLMPNALEKGKKKKNIALILYQKKIIKNAKTIIASSKPESKSLQAFFTSNNIVEVPHGISLPNESALINKRKKEKKYCLFLGRINPTKGLEKLIKVWKELNNKNWELLIAGITEDLSYFNELKKTAGDININFIGEIWGDDKEKIFQKTSLFVLPTKTENFGIVIAEAMSYGIPVITTKDAPWDVISKKDLGWWIENNNTALLNALYEATNMNSNDLLIKGEKAKIFVTENLSWNIIKKKYIEIYKKITT